MQQVIILHAWGNAPEDYWYPLLANELTKKGYRVVIPELVDKDKPELGTWRECVLSKTKIDGSTIIIGHSLGAVLALKLAEEFKFDTLITVAGWDYWDRTPEHESFFRTIIDQNKIIENVKSRIVFHSDNDPYVTKILAGEFADRMKAKFNLVVGKAHFTAKDGVTEMPEIVSVL